MASSDLCTLAQAKSWLNIPLTTTSDDALLSGVVTNVSNDFMREIKRLDFFPSENYSETREGDGGSSMILRHWPLNEIASVSINGVGVQTANYEIDMDLDPERRWEIYLTNGMAFTDTATIVIAYNAGYEEVPGEVNQAVIEWVADRYKSRQNIGQTQKHMLQGESVTVPAMDMPASVRRIVEQYRRFDPLQIPVERTPATDYGHQNQRRKPRGR